MESDSTACIVWLYHHLSHASGSLRDTEVTEVNEIYVCTVGLYCVSNRVEIWIKAMTSYSQQCGHE